MIDLTQATGKDIAVFGRELLAQYREGLSSFEEAAQHIVETIYQQMSAPDGSPAFALLRIFRLANRDDLPRDLRKLLAPEAQKTLTLMGTWGLEPAWCQRQHSSGHQALMLGEGQSPMVSATLRQLALDVGVELPALRAEMEAVLPMPEATFMTRYVHIEHALRSPFVPAQKEFVEPYGFQPVVGIGSGFASGSAYMMLGFARVHVTGEMAKNFAQIAPFVSTGLAIYNEQAIWSA